MDFNRAFSFITQDKEWFKKLIIAGLLLLPGITAFAVVGWAVEIVRRVRRDDPTPLPAWTEFGKFFADGLKILGVSLVWSLPIILLSVCFTTLMIASGDSLNTSDAMQTVFPIAILCFTLLTIAYSIFLAVMSFPLIGLVADDLPFAKLISPATGFSYFRANPGGYLMTGFIGGFLANLIASLGTIACGVGILITGPFAMAFYAHLMAQAHGKAVLALAGSASSSDSPLP